MLTLVWAAVARRVMGLDVLMLKAMAPLSSDGLSIRNNLPVQPAGEAGTRESTLTRRGRPAPDGSEIGNTQRAGRGRRAENTDGCANSAAVSVTASVVARRARSGELPISSKPLTHQTRERRSRFPREATDPPQPLFQFRTEVPDWQARAVMGPAALLVWQAPRRFLQGAARTPERRHDFITDA
ncbi:hypothetical protein CHELA1G11_12153 [Hyphomicrobiales bacterium]|nr:hypothetical protein CHELA1G11_12153 [Hyphomicrobiales bacterium]CAH1662944.1 hypothetical protein CHELA1G2_12160 [Hyphomicrobiales bacterium]